MAIHLLRDYANQSLTPAGPVTADQIPWLLAIFMRRVLGYTVVGQTNFDLDSATYLVASGTGAGQKAGINFGAGFFYEVSIPVGVRVVTGADVGRMLVLKSNANPRFNSGVFVITAINTTDNRYVINWRSGDTPPAEAVDTMEWWLYVADLTRPGTRGANGGTGYRSFGSSTCSRIILQSPHALAWQVRICLESSNDWSTTEVTNQITYAPGFGGDASGDFAVGGPHLHSALWWDTATTEVAQVPGIGSTAAGSESQYRITMIGDTEGTGVYCLVRRPNAIVANTHWHFQFGLCENELTPLPPTNKSVCRLFMMGNNIPGQGSNSQAGLVANATHYHGLGFGFNGQPVAANVANWTHIETNAGFGGAPWYNANAGNNPFTGSTDLLPVDVVSGTAENWFNNALRRTHQYEPRLLGILPFVRQGRSNFGTFTLSTEATKDWQHFQNGIYMMWGGPAVLA